MATPAQVPIPQELYGMISGNLDSAAVQRILSGFSNATQNDVKKMHVMLQSLGGGIGDGICLYNFFRNVPIDLTLYNTGGISSIAVIAYLGAKTRKVSANAAFMIHRTQTTTQSANTQTVKAFVESAVLFDENTEAILREHIHMPEAKWQHFNHNDLWFSATEAVEYGIATEIGDFSPPPGTKLFNV
jgi:ATP-dependent Clp protease protease subunit